MKHYINIWSILSISFLIYFVVLTIKAKKEQKKRLILSAFSIFFLIIWNTSFRYYNMHVNVAYAAVLFWGCVYIDPTDKMEHFIRVLLILTSFVLWVAICMLFTGPYDMWYVSKYVKEEVQSEPEKVEYTMPNETTTFRLKDGLDNYPIRLKKGTSLEGYDYIEIEFFSEEKDDQDESKSYCYLQEKTARYVKILPKKAGEEDHVVQYTYHADMIDLNTGLKIRPIYYNVYEFYVPKEVAEAYNVE